jgi:hypothetical protein
MAHLEIVCQHLSECLGWVLHIGFHQLRIHPFFPIIGNSGLADLSKRKFRPTRPSDYCFCLKPQCGKGLPFCAQGFPWVTGKPNLFTQMQQRGWYITKGGLPGGTCQSFYVLILCLIATYRGRCWGRTTSVTGISDVEAIASVWIGSDGDG